MQSKHKFVYKPRSAETVEKRAQGDNLFDGYFKQGVSIFKTKLPGKYRVRILPATWENPEHYGYDIWVNYGIGADKQSYLSLGKMGKGKDFIAEERVRASNEGREEDAKALAPKKATLVWVIDRKAENEGPKLWAMPMSIDKEVITRSFDADTRAVLAVDDPYNGYDITFTKEGDGLKTRYVGVEVARNFSPLSNDEKTLNDWIDYVVENPIPDMLHFYSYDHIKSVFTGESENVTTVDPFIEDVAVEEDNFDDTNLVGSHTLPDETSQFDGTVDDEPPFDVEDEKPTPKASEVGSRLKLRRR